MVLVYVKTCATNGFVSTLLMLTWMYFKNFIRKFKPLILILKVSKVNPNLTEGGRKRGWRKKAWAARPPGPGLEPGTCRVLGEGPQLHAMGAV